MKRLASAALLGLLLCGAPALGQTYLSGSERTVENWYAKFLGRQADPDGLATWSNALRTGTPPNQVLGTILGSDEYYQNAGYSRSRFVRNLFLDLAGREPLPQEYDYWLRRLDQNDRITVATDLVNRFPTHWQSGPRYYAAPSSGGYYDNPPPPPPRYYDYPGVMRYYYRYRR